ncbi:hypothetical protein BDW22DRAFT_1329856 [Trametopsis cervina]|nr:hypothetical protein BDW22DRAFT_1329856 [Trametopsis cervina]
MVVHIQNRFEGKKFQDVAKKLIGERVFINWPFLQEGKIVAISDPLFKYEKMVVTPGNPPKVISNPHSPQGLGLWKSKAERIEHFYSKRCGVLTGDIEVILHIRPLKGLKRLDDGALVKEYEGPEKETEQALQMAVTEVTSEDPRYVEKEAPPLSEEFPEGSKVFFLGEHAYGVAAQVSETTKDQLSIILAFFPNSANENAQFREIVTNRSAQDYYPSYEVSDMTGLSGMAVAKIMSSFMVLTSDGHKHNLGLSIKFEAKGMKVIDYSRKNGRHWEFSDKAVGLLKEYKAKFPEVMKALHMRTDAMARASDIFAEDIADSKIKEVKDWLQSKGVRAFEPVSLFCDQLKKDTVKEIEALADSLTAKQSADGIKKAMVKGIPRQAVLKPAHAAYRLQTQHFALGDRVTMIQDSGAVPLSVKGVVIGLNAKSMDVVWDVAFMAGTTLGDRCSHYRGSTVEFTSCLNLSNPQFIASSVAQGSKQPFKPRIGPRPAIEPPPGEQGASGFRPAPQIQGAPVHIMSNPHRGRGAVHNHQNGRGRGGFNQFQDNSLHDNHEANGHAQSHRPHSQRGGSAPQILGRGQAVPRGGFPFRGRGGGNSERGRGGPRGGFRGRGRGQAVAS